MQKPKVFVTREIPERGLQIIKERFEAEVWPEYAPPPKEVIIKKATGVDALVSLLSDRIDTEVFDAAPNLKIVSQIAVGYDNIDLQEATKRGIYITNTPGVLTEATADFSWALLMAVARRITEADQYVRSGKWKVSWHPSMLLGRDVYGATIGIVGMGRIGQSMASRAKGFNMKILYYDVIRREDLEKAWSIEFLDLNTLFRKADFVTIHIPLTKETHHMVDERRLRLMKKTAFLINNSRGPVVDEKALFRALKEKWIAGAGLDVFEEEPTPVVNPLLEFDNVVVAPHVSSGTHETRSRMAEMVTENLVAFFDGRIPPNLVNREVLEVKKPIFL